MIAFITLWILLARTLLAWQTIAHRGVYHDVTDFYSLAENTVNAILRAHSLGLPGVEIDLQLDSSGEVLVTHDAISNRATMKDNDNGILNPIDVALNLQPSVPAFPFAGETTQYWQGTTLKVYGHNGTIIPGTLQQLQTLDYVLAFVQYGIGDPNFLLILDIQNPTILLQASRLVRNYGLESSVFLKFFATSAINSANYPYNGADTCYQYAVDNNLSGLKIIPQINDGQLTYENGTAYLPVFQTTLTIHDYLQCWADAQQQHARNGAALMPIVSASVPSSSTINYEPAYQAALDAMNWAAAHGRRKMSVAPNPDAGRLINDFCELWTFQSNSVSAVPFDERARSSKYGFATGPGNADFIIIDVMGDWRSDGWYTASNQFDSYLC